MKRQSSKNEVEMANQHDKCLTSLATRETELKTSLSSHLTPVRMVIIKKTNKQKTNINKDMGPFLYC